MKILGIIPSRYGSSRFPGKPLALLCGKPLVAWVVEAVKKAQSLDDVIVATDDVRIADAVAAHGGRAVMTPSDLPSGTDRIACAAGDFADDDILVNIQGDEPLIAPALIDALVARLREPGGKWDAIAREACTFTVSHAGRSPRIARQFVDLYVARMQQD